MMRRKAAFQSKMLFSGGSKNERPPAHQPKKKSIFFGFVNFFLSKASFFYRRLFKKKMVNAILCIWVCFTSYVMCSFNKIVVDTDGSAEGLAALTTLLLHPDGSEQLSLITLSGAGWTHLQSAENNVRNFLQLMGRERIPVAAGAEKVLSDAYSSSTGMGACQDSNFFPETPSDARLRGMKISRYDVDNLFGLADGLPRSSGYGSTGRDPVLDDTSAATRGLGQLLSTSDMSYVKYIALSGLTNLAIFLQDASGRPSPMSPSGTLRDLALSRLHVIVNENGNNIPLDPAASAQVLSAPGIHGTVFTPQFAAPVTFSHDSWDRLMYAAAAPGAHPGVVLIANIWSQRKALIDGTVTNSVEFFKDKSVCASLVSLWTIDPNVNAAFRHLLGSNKFMSLQFLRQKPPVAPSSLAFYPLSGNAVVPSGFLQVNITSGDVVGASGFVVVKDPATTQQTTNPLATFWGRWFSLVEQTPSAY